MKMLSKIVCLAVGAVLNVIVCSQAFAKVLCEEKVNVFNVYVSDPAFSSDHTVGIQIRRSDGSTLKYQSGSVTGIDENQGKAMLQLAMYAYVGGNEVDVFRANTDKCPMNGEAGGGFVNKWGGIRVWRFEP